MDNPPRVDDVMRSSPEIELFACKSCGAYHYLNSCIYNLSWCDWLEYHNTYMPSQPYNLPPGVIALEELEELRDRARLLDETVAHRPNYLSNTRLKKDLMTQSGIGAFWDDEEWRLKLQPGSAYRARKQQLLRVRRLDDRSSEASDWNGSDEDVWDAVRSSFGKHLPGNSTATLFRAEPDGSEAVPHAT